MLILWFSRLHASVFPPKWYNLANHRSKKGAFPLKIWTDERRLLKGNLHTHTNLSDGKVTPEAAMEIYRAAGYDFIAISDHRQVSTPTTYHQNLLAIQAVEFDFNLIDQVMHIVGLDVPAEIAAQISQAAGPQAAIDAINAADGFAILAHPAWSFNTPESMGGLRGVSAAEIYNTVSGLPWSPDRADSSAVLDLCAANGHLFHFLASDDAHYYNGDAAQSFIMLAAQENTPAAIKAALRRGDFYASRGPLFHSIDFDVETVSVSCSPVRAIWFPSDSPSGAGRVTAGENLTHAQYKVPPRCRRFVRAVIEDAQGRRAWSNPIALPR